MELEVKEVVLSESDDMSLCLKVAFMCQKLDAGPQWPQENIHLLTSILLEWFIIQSWAHINVQEV